MKLVVTAHAVEQYRRRHAPDIGYDAAHAVLASAGGHAQHRSHAAFKGEVYDIPELECEAVMVDEGEIRTMVTVLPRRADRISAAETQKAAAKLLAASEAADAARLKQHELKVISAKLGHVPAASNPHKKAVRRSELLQLEVSILKHEMRLANEQGQREAKIAKSALRIAVRALIAAGDHEALRAIQRMEPYFTAPLFVDPEPEPEPAAPDITEPAGG